MNGDNKAMTRHCQRHQDTHEEDFRLARRTLQQKNIGYHLYAMEDDITAQVVIKSMLEYV